MNTLELLKIPYWIVPEREAMVFEGLRLTYAQVMERVNRLADALAQRGVKRGTRVAVLHTNCHNYLEAYFATALLGGVFVPLNFRAKREELVYMLNDSESSVLFVGDRYVPLVNDFRHEVPLVQDYIAMESPQEGMVYYEDLLAAADPERGMALEEDMNERDLAVLIYTSGTTALPKGVMLTYGGFTSYIMNAVEPDPEAPPTAALISAPFYHIAGFSSALIGIYGLRRLVIMRQFEVKQWLELAQAEKVTHVFLVPTMVRQLIEYPEFSRYDLSSLRSVTYGGAPMPVPVVQKAIEMFPKHVEFVNAFGQTETLSTVTALGPEDHRLEGTPEEVEKKIRRLGSIGKPVGDVVVKIIDDEGNELPRGEVGEIAIFVGRAMAGYWKREAETASTLVDGWIRTRDMGWMDEDGYIFLAGRKSDMIIRGGENIAPEQIESILYLHPAVEDVAVIGIPDEEWGEEVVAVVIPKPGTNPTAEELINYTKERIASYKAPKQIVFVNELPRNHLGKVLKNVLRDQFKTLAKA